MNYAAVDGCNVACGVSGKKPGDAENILRAVNALIERNYEVVVFLQQHWYSPGPKSKAKTIANKELLDNLPAGASLTIIPSRSDDDAYFINWAMSKNAILVSNDGLTSHKEKFEENDRLKEFILWNKTYRVQYTFIADEFTLDPDFVFPQVQPVEDSVEPIKKTTPKAAKQSSNVKKLLKPTLPPEVGEIEEAVAEKKPSSNSVIIGMIKDYLLNEFNSNKMIKILDFKKNARVIYQLESNLQKLPKWNEVKESLGLEGPSISLETILEGVDYSTTRNHIHNLNCQQQDLINSIIETINLEILQNGLLPVDNKFNDLVIESANQYLNQCNPGRIFDLSMVEVKSLAGYSISWNRTKLVQQLCKDGDFTIGDEIIYGSANVNQQHDEVEKVAENKVEEESKEEIELLNSEQFVESDIVAIKIDKAPALENTNNEEKVDSNSLREKNIEDVIMFTKTLVFKPMDKEILDTALDLVEEMRDSNQNYLSMVNLLNEKLASDVPKVRIKNLLQSIFLADNQAIKNQDIPNWTRIPKSANKKKSAIKKFWKNHPKVNQEKVDNYFAKAQKTDAKDDTDEYDLRVKVAKGWASIHQAWQDENVMFAYYIPSQKVWCMKVKYAMIGETFLDKFSIKISKIFRTPQSFCTMIGSNSPNWALSQESLMPALEFSVFYKYHAEYDTICIPVKDTEIIRNIISDSKKERLP